jgi:hypothetical protein
MSSLAHTHSTDKKHAAFQGSFHGSFEVDPWLLLEDFPGVLALRLSEARKRPRKHLTYEFVNEEMAAAMARSQVHEQIVVPEARQGECMRVCMCGNVTINSAKE